MRIEQLNGKEESVVVDSSAMDVDDAPPDLAKKKSDSHNDSEDITEISMNGNMENGVNDSQKNGDAECDTTNKGDSDAEENESVAARNGDDSSETPQNGVKDDSSKATDVDDDKEDKTEHSKEIADSAKKTNDNVSEKDNGDADDTGMSMECEDVPNENSNEEEQASPKEEKAKDSPVLNGEIQEERFPRRSLRPPKGPSVNSLLAASLKEDKVVKVTETKAPKQPEVKTPKPAPAKKTPQKPAKVSHFRIDDRKVPEEMEHMRAMAKVVYGIGLDLAKQMVYKDLVRVQTKRDGLGQLNKKEQDQLVKLRTRHEELCAVNKTYTKSPDIRCTFPGCEVKTDSLNALNYHLDEPHRSAKGDIQCSHCRFTTRIPMVYSSHMENLHKRRPHDFYRSGYLECNMCSYDCINKSGLLKHKQKCEKKFSLKRNLNPFYEVCDIPIKKMFMPKAPPPGLLSQPPRPIKAAVKKDVGPTKTELRHQAQQKARVKLQQQKQQLMSKVVGQPPVLPTGMPQPVPQFVPAAIPNMPAFAQGSVVPQTYAIGGNMYTLVNNNGQFMLQAIQPPPRSQPFPVAGLSGLQPMQPSRPAAASMPNLVSQITSPPKAQGAAKAPSAQLEICEICGGFVKDRESLRVHFYWAHKIDIRKDVFTRKTPSLSCDHCPEKFWTFQGYDRHRKSTHKNIKPSSEAKSLAPQQTVQCPLCRSPAAHIINHLLSVHNVSVNTALEKRQCTICLISFPNLQEVEEHLIHLHGFSFLQNMPKPKMPARVANPAPGKALKPGQAKPPVPVGLFAHNKQFDPTCTICNITFKRVQDFTSHCNKYHIFKCYRCGCRWNTYALLVRHLAESHFSAQDECIICKGRFTAGIPFIQHMLTSHIKGLSVRIKRLSPSTINFYMKRNKGNARRVSQGPLVISPRIQRNLQEATLKPAVIDVDPSPVQQPAVIDVDSSPTKQPIILKIDDNDGDDETIEIHENTTDDVVE